MLEEQELELRSEEVQEILSQVPHWMIRWGNVVILFILGSLLYLSWLIKYPDLIKTQIVITTNIPPEKLVAKTSGKIEAIFIKDKGTVKKNTPLAVIENSADYNALFLLKSIVDTIDIYKNKFPFSKLNSLEFGEVENAFALFQKEYVTEELNSKLQPFKVEGTAQNYEFIQLKERLKILISQRTINEKELVLQKSELNRYEILFKKGIIAAQDIEKQRLYYLQAEKNYNSLLSNISQLKSSLNELNKNSKSNQINENKENVNLEQNVVQAFFQLKKAIKDWDLKYILRSSINGKVTFLQIWTENQTVNEGDNVFSIIPNNKNGYIGKATAATLNSGKIKIGQKVNVSLFNFPEREFGSIRGIVTGISLTPDKGGNLLINISFPEGLKTSYNKEISFQQEMSGAANIISDDLRLIERLLYQFRDIFSR